MSSLTTFHNGEILYFSRLLEVGIQAPVMKKKKKKAGMFIF